MSSAWPWPTAIAVGRLRRTRRTKTCPALEVEAAAARQDLEARSKDGRKFYRTEAMNNLIVIRRVS